MEGMHQLRKLMLKPSKATCRLLLTAVALGMAKCQRIVQGMVLVLEQVLVLVLVLVLSMVLVQVAKRKIGRRHNGQPLAGLQKAPQKHLVMVLVLVLVLVRVLVLVLAWV